MTSEEKFGERC